MVWGTPESVPALVRMLDDPFPPAREEALAALAALKDPQAAEPVARRLGDFVAHTVVLDQPLTVGRRAAVTLIWLALLAGAIWGAVTLRPEWVSAIRSRF